MDSELKAPPTLDSLAMEFCDALRATLTPEQMEQVAALNSAATSSAVCHSHDFCDANLVLYEVFMRHSMDPVSEEGMERHGALWDQVWNLAKSREFRIAD